MTGALTEQLLDAIYDLPLSAGEWRYALHTLRDLLGSAEIAFTVVDSRSSQPALWETTGAVLSSRQCDAYQSDFMRLDPKLPILSQRGRGFLFNDIEHFDDSFVAHDPFYQGYSLPLGVRHTLDLFVDSCNGRNVYLAAMRSSTQGPYDDVASAQLRSASTHLVRALKARDEIAQVELAARRANSALDQLDFGIAVVDVGARLCLANAFARAAFARGVPLSLIHSRVFARTDENLIAEKIHGAIAGRPSTFRLRNREGWIISAIPLPATSPLAPSTAASAMLVFRHSQRLVSPAAQDVMSIFGLTRAEAEIAVGIGAGKSLRALAASRNVKTSTVRWQLLAVLRKLEVRRQADVVRVLAAIRPAAGLRS
jgi:DNA-binding CsgD family transcriptional regulator